MTAPPRPDQDRSTGRTIVWLLVAMVGAMAAAFVDPDHAGWYILLAITAIIIVVVSKK